MNNIHFLKDEKINYIFEITSNLQCSLELYSSKDYIMNKDDELKLEKIRNLIDNAYIKMKELTEE